MTSNPRLMFQFAAATGIRPCFGFSAGHGGGRRCQQRCARSQYEAAPRLPSAMLLSSAMLRGDPARGFAHRRRYERTRPVRSNMEFSDVWCGRRSF